jgi:hypothetical protein
MSLYVLRGMENFVLTERIERSGDQEYAIPQNCLAHKMVMARAHY